MINDQIKLAVLKVIKKSNIKSFPIDCFKLLDENKFKYRTYSSQSTKKREKCISYSKDAFTLKGIVYYNDEMPLGRIRFSLMHELGHKVLHHTDEETPEQEKEADIFASNILAPRMAIHYSKCKNQNDVVKTFNVSQEAAQYAFADYRRWHRWTVYHKMNDFDKAMYSHFHNSDANCFVYNIKKCAYCDSPLYNTKDIVCIKCNAPGCSFLKHQPNSEDFMIAESQWLYSGL
jgi:Zn-dependent peptidase ImmA (M78 family)